MKRGIAVLILMKEGDSGTHLDEYGEKYREQNYSVGELISDKMWDEDGNETDCY